MLKGKIEASGYPDWAETQLQRKDYIESIFNTTGVVLDTNNIEFNPAARLYYKLKLNALWGKYAQNPFMKSQTEVVTNYERLMEINKSIIDKKS